MKSSKIYNYLVFIIAATSSISVSIFGLVNISELLMIGLLPWLIFTKKRSLKSFSKNEKEVKLMIFVWVIGIIISDVLNGTPLSKFLKGIGNPIVILLSFLCMNLLIQRTSNFFKNLLAGLIVSASLNYLVDKVAYEQFRFGIFMIIVSILFYIIYLYWIEGKTSVVYYLLLFMALLGFMKGGRSSGVIFLLTLMILYFANKYSLTAKYISLKKMIPYFAIFVVAIFAIQELYVLAVKNKMFSDDFQTKFEEQMATGLPVILSGRTEFFSSSQAIKDAPFFGHGSWAEDSKYVRIILEKTTDLTDKEKFDYNIDNYGLGRIPAHSFIFGEWVEHGIISVSFFLFFGNRLLKLLLYILANIKKAEMPFLVYVLITYSWHFFFSPLGGDKRLLFVVILCIESFSLYQRDIMLAKRNERNITVL